MRLEWQLGRARSRGWATLPGREESEVWMRFEAGKSLGNLWQKIKNKGLRDMG